MARSGTHATEHDVPSAACAMDGIACGQKYPEVRTRSRTVQRASGGTRRRVQNDEDTVFARVKPSCSTVFARVNTAEKRSTPEPDRRTVPLSIECIKVEQISSTFSHPILIFHILRLESRSSPSQWRVIDIYTFLL